MPAFLRIHPADNVAVALEPLEAGAVLALPEGSVTALEPIPVRAGKTVQFFIYFPIILIILGASLIAFITYFFSLSSFSSLIFFVSTSLEKSTEHLLLFLEFLL